MKVQIFEHDGCLIMNPSPIKQTKSWIPTGKGTIGCVLVDTKRRLECSQEAIDLMKTIPRSSDCIGDIDWFKSEKSGWCFSWIGDIYKITRVTESALSTARDTIISAENCTIIPNKPTPEMIEGVKAGGWQWRK